MMTTMVAGTTMLDTTLTIIPQCRTTMASTGMRRCLWNPSMAPACIHRTTNIQPRGLHINNCNRS
jgi:hypothetical protein